LHALLRDGPDGIEIFKHDKAKKDFLPRNPPSLYQHGCGINRHKKALHAKNGMKGCTQLT